MAGDVGIQERAIVLTDATATDSLALARSLQQAQGRVSHHYGRQVVISEVPGENELAFRDAIRESALERPGRAVTVAASMSDVPEGVTAGLDPAGLLGLAAFDLRQSDEYARAKAERPLQGESWDTAAASAPDLGPTATAPESLESPGPPAVATSERLSGSVAVGIIIVSGPNSNLQFSPAETTKVVAEVQNGLSWLGSQTTGEHISWHYDIHSVSIAVQPNPSAPDLEALWRNPTMVSLGFTGDFSGVGDYIRSIRTSLQTDWTYCAFFTKYPVFHFAYASLGGPRLVMQYSNDGWGPDNIDRVFAHETGHIFNAPDEYASSGCNCVSQFGFFHVPNENCQNCAPGGGVDCIMKGNSWTMCSFTPWHLGFTGLFSAAYFQGDPGSGIGGYDLASPADLAFAFDYDSSDKLDHLALYRPGTGTIWILQNSGGTFSPVYQQGDPGNGIGGYNLASPADRAFAFDYDSSGKLDHLALYRPGTGTIWILQNSGGTFSPVYQQGDPGNGIGGYDLASTADLAFAFDYDSSGKLDHLVLYRPGTGTIWILQNSGGTFSPVYQQGDPGNGIGGYDLASTADRAFAFDYDGSGKLDHVALYRPGTGTIWILKNSGGTFSPVYQQGDPGNGIGGYDLASPADLAFAFDYDGSGKLDHLALYRPGTGTIWILQNSSGTFSPVYHQGDPGNGIGGYDLASAADRAFAFDYETSGFLDNLVLYRPGKGAIAILNEPGTI